MQYQYFLREEDLPTLHRNYDLFYDNVVKTSAIDALKVKKMLMLLALSIVNISINLVVLIIAIMFIHFFKRLFITVIHSSTTE